MRISGLDTARNQHRHCLDPDAVHSRELRALQELLPQLSLRCSYGTLRQLDWIIMGDAEMLPAPKRCSHRGSGNLLFSGCYGTPRN